MFFTDSENTPRKVTLTLLAKDLIIINYKSLYEALT